MSRVHVFPNSCSFLKLNCLISFRNKFPFGNLCCRNFSESCDFKYKDSMASSEKDVVDHEVEKEAKHKQVPTMLDQDETTGDNMSIDTMTSHDKTDDTNPTGLSNRARRRMERNKFNKAKRKALHTKTMTKNLSPGFSTDYFGLTEYYYENGLRKVYPYYFQFESFVKGRWLGKTVTEILKEFQVDPADRVKNMEDMLKDGDVTLNGEAVTTDHILKNKDYLAHRIHRHENPVIGTPLEIVVDNEDVIVINKPSSIPVHPCGRYRFNSIPFIIGKDLGYTNLRTIYRLDRLTSGVLILAKSAEKTREMEDDIQQRRVQKEYLARVLGKFPDGVMECDQPLGVLSSKDSLYGVVQGGKASKTGFEYISYNGTSSLIRCFPQTGRTHQIRLHLQYLGFPIKNDPLYNQGCFGPNNAKGGILEKTVTEIVTSFRANHNTGLWVKGDNAMFHTRLEEVKADHTDVKQQQEANSTQILKEACQSKPSQEDACILNQKEASSSSQCEGKVSDLNLCEAESVHHSTAFPGEEPNAKRPRLVDPDDDTSTASVTVDQRTQPVRAAKQPEFDARKWVPDEKCFYCRKSFKDPAPADMIMYLHALKYKGPKWEYETPLPDWARQDWIEPQ